MGKIPTYPELIIRAWRLRSLREWPTFLRLTSKMDFDRCSNQRIGAVQYFRCCEEVVRAETAARPWTTLRRCPAVVLTASKGPNERIKHQPL